MTRQLHIGLSFGPLVFPLTFTKNNAHDNLVAHTHCYGEVTTDLTTKIIALEVTTELTRSRELRTDYVTTQTSNSEEKITTTHTCHRHIYHICNSYTNIETDVYKFLST